MKSILKMFFCILLLPNQAHSDVIGMMKNNIGGNIVITNEACIINGQRFLLSNRAYSFDGAGIIIDEGCWTEQCTTTTISWKSGPLKEYDCNKFMVPKKTIFKVE